MKKLIILIAFSTISVLSFSQTLDNGLVGYWTFNAGSLQDESNNSNNGSLVGDPITQINDNWGNVNGAYEFNGTDEYIQIPHSSDFNTVKAISLWFKTANNIDDDNNEICGLFNKRLGSGDYAGFHIYIYGNTDPNHATNGRIQVGNDPGSGSVTSLNSVNNVWNNNTWYHLVINLDGTGKIYINGEDNTNTSTLSNSSFTNSTSSIHLGRYQAGNSTYFNGSVDEVRMYNRVLTESEIQDLYSGSTSSPSVGWQINGNKVFIDDGNVGIGTSDPQTKLSVDGVILAKEIKVKTDISTYPDFVFDKDYKLRTLTEIEQYINKHGHLHEIPKAEEAEAEGISLGEMNAKLLQKIEELTLYIIELEKRLDEHDSEIQELKK